MTYGLMEDIDTKQPRNRKAKKGFKCYERETQAETPTDKSGFVGSDLGRVLGRASVKRQTSMLTLSLRASFRKKKSFIALSKQKPKFSKTSKI